jgi:hypothetical protein
VAAELARELGVPVITSNLAVARQLGEVLELQTVER